MRRRWAARCLGGWPHAAGSGTAAPSQKASSAGKNGQPAPRFYLFTRDTDALCLLHSALGENAALSTLKTPGNNNSLEKKKKKGEQENRISLSKLTKGQKAWSLPLMRFV